jgi:hypothetical protein
LKLEHDYFYLLGDRGNNIQSEQNSNSENQITEKGPLATFNTSVNKLFITTRKKTCIHTQCA